MKNQFLLIFTGILISLSLFFVAENSEPQYAFASCAADIDYNAKLESSELVFTGTVARLDNYDGPQKVTFFIHDIIKGEVDTPKHVLENRGMIFLENDTVMSSSVSVDYTIGKTYKVYVENGDTNSCTTKLITPPADYMWEPGPEDGNYYSENPEYANTCEKGYGLSDGMCVTLEEMNNEGILPVCNPNPGYDFGKCKRDGNYLPDIPLQDVLDNCSCQESGQACIEPELRWWNATHFIDNIDCKFLDKSEGSTTYGQAINSTASGVTDHYGLESNGEVLCLGGRDMILDDQCRRIGNYDVKTGIPIVNSKEECDRIDGAWYDDKRLCDSEYAPTEYRLQFGPEHNVYDDSEEMRMASEKVYFAEESMAGGSGTSFLNYSDFQLDVAILAVLVGLGSFLSLMIFWRKRR